MATIFDDEKLYSFNLKKNLGKTEVINQYHINVNCTFQGKQEKVGYIYFYMDEILKESHFIGMYVSDNHRGHGLGTKLISAWLKLCWDNDFFNLATNQKQRKPFLLHILKKFGFEIRDTRRYDLSSSTICICRGLDPNKKYLLFKSSIQGADFQKQAIFERDNYEILPFKSEEYQIIDRVLPLNIYHLINHEEAYNKAKLQEFKSLK